jgi:biotin-(acetyl-CoA carboxylase) ligase
MQGESVRVSEPGGRVLRGQVLGVDGDGALRLTDGSAERRVVAGEVTLASEAGEVTLISEAGV